MQVDFMEALKNNASSDRVSELIKTEKVNINGWDEYGETPLILSSQNGNVEVIKVLLDAGVDVNGRCEDGRTALMNSTDVEVVQTLLTAGANVNARDRLGETALMAAMWDIFGEDPKVTETLINAGADVNAQNKAGLTALMLGVAKDINPKIIESLLAAGADVNMRDNDGWTPLMYAAKNNKNPEIIKMLVDAKTNVNLQSQDGWTALALAASKNQTPEVLKELIAAGADVNARNEEGETALMWAAYKNKNSQIAEALLNAGADINAQDENGKTALMLSTRQHDELTNFIYTNVMRELLAAGADVNIQDKNGKTALDYAPNAKVRLMLVEAQQSQMGLEHFKAGEEVSISSNLDPQKNFTGKIAEIVNEGIKIIDSRSGKECLFSSETLFKSGDWRIEKIAHEEKLENNLFEKTSKETIQREKHVQSQGLER